MITYGSTTLTSYNTITKIEVYYYQSTSPTTQTGGSWSTTKPTWVNGRYVWQKIRTTYEGKLDNGSYYSESDPVNITGQQGATGTSAYSYKLNASDTVVSISKNGVYSTNNITFSATYKQGTGAISAYAGRFKIETTADGATWTTQYTSSANESSKKITLPKNILVIRCSLYQAGGTTVLLDIVSVPIVKDGIDGTSQNLLLDVYATSLDKVKAPWNRYLSDSGNTTITGQFIAEDNLPDPNATHFYRITDSSASTKQRGLCFYNGGTPPFLDGHTYRIGCWVRNHAGSPSISFYLGTIGAWTNRIIITNTNWEWIECVHTFGDVDPAINAPSSTYKRIYFYFGNNNVEGSSLDMCGFKVEEIQTDISTARNYLLKTEKLDGWGITGGATISNGVATFPEVTTNAWREIYPGKNFKYELIRNKNIIFSVRVKADVGKICACNLCIGVDSTETAYTRQKYTNNFVYFTGTGEWQTICVAIPISDEIFTSGSGTPNYDNCWVTVRIGAVLFYHNSFQVKQPQLSLGTTATAWSAAPEDIEASMQEKVDNIEIGGRNLIPHSKNLQSFTIEHTERVVATYLEDSCTIVNIYGNARYGIYYNIKVEPNVTYTLSFYASNISGTNTNYAIGNRTPGQTASWNDITKGYQQLVEGKTVYTFTVPDTITLIRIYFCAGSLNGTCTIKNVKLEKGNKPTDWSPAPEDTQADIDQAKNLATAVYGTCSTDAGTAAKAVTCSNFVLFDGARIQVTFTNANTASAPTLNVNSTGAKAIYINKTVTSSSNLLLWTAGSKMEFVYDGTGWIAQNIPYALYGTCSTSASTAAKTATCNEAVICKGTTISINMTNTNTAANATLNVGSTVAKDIYANGTKLTVNSRFNWRANTVQKFVFDGQVWRMDDDSVKALATAYITEIDEDGIMVHPEDDSTSGWAISDAIQLFKNGISYIKLWIENNIPKIRIGKEDQGHIILDNDSVDVRNGDDILASFGETSIIGDQNQWHQTIASDKTSFANGQTEYAYISPDKFYAVNAEVSDAFYIGNYSIRNAKDGKLIIGLRRK